MAALNEVGVTNGVPDSGTGEVATINALMAVTATEVTLADVKTAVEALAALIAGGALTTSLDAGSPGIITTGTQASPAADYLSSVVAGDKAHDAADSGNPTKIGARATTALSALTLVADGDRTNVHAGLDGVLITRPHCNLEAIVTGNATNTDGTSTSCIATSGSGIKTYLTSVILANTSAVAITVDIKDGSTTKFTLPIPAGSGCIFNPPVPIPGTANTAWNFDPSAAATTVTCSMVGFKSKV